MNPGPGGFGGGLGGGGDGGGRGLSGGGGGGGGGLSVSLCSKPWAEKGKSSATARRAVAKDDAMMVAEFSTIYVNTLNPMIEILLPDCMACHRIVPVPERSQNEFRFHLVAFRICYRSSN